MVVFERSIGDIVQIVVVSTGELIELRKLALKNSHNYRAQAFIVLYRLPINSTEYSRLFLQTHPSVTGLPGVRKCPSPGTDKMNKCPRGYPGGWAQVATGGID